MRDNVTLVQESNERWRAEWIASNGVGGCFGTGRTPGAALIELGKILDTSQSESMRRHFKPRPLTIEQRHTLLREWGEAHLHVTPSFIETSTLGD